jgi:hypothetical protein
MSRERLPMPEERPDRLNDPPKANPVLTGPPPHQDKRQSDIEEVLRKQQPAEQEHRR